MNGGHYQLLKSVNVGDSKLEGIKVNAYELGWRYTGDNLRTQIAAYYSLSDKSIAINKTDMTINVHADKRRIYGVEGAVDYFFEDSDWSAGTNFNVIRSETKVNGEWKKLVVDTASPSKVTAYVGWAPGDWNLRLQSQQTFDVSDDGDYTKANSTRGRKIDGYNTPTSSAAIPCRWGKSASAWKTCWTKSTPPFGANARRSCTARPTAHLSCTVIKAADAPSA